MPFKRGPGEYLINFGRFGDLCGYFYNFTIIFTIGGRTMGLIRYLYRGQRFFSGVLFACGTCFVPLGGQGRGCKIGVILIITGGRGPSILKSVFNVRATSVRLGPYGAWGRKGQWFWGGTMVFYTTFP